MPFDNNWQDHPDAQEERMSQPELSAIVARITALEDALLRFANDVFRTGGALNSPDYDSLQGAIKAAREAFAMGTAGSS